MRDTWFSGEGTPISLKDMTNQIDEYVSGGGKLFVGTDSQLKSDGCVFVTAVCLHSNVGKKYEVQESLKISLSLLEKYPEADVEVHVDVGRTNRSATRKFADSISGWLTGVGLECKMKPYSWASSSVADWHTK